MSTKEGELVNFNLLEIKDTLESLTRRINHLRDYVAKQDLERSLTLRAPADGGGVLINHKKFFQKVLSGEIELSNQDESDIFASWMVGGQDFYVYGVTQTPPPLRRTGNAHAVSRR